MTAQSHARQFIWILLLLTSVEAFVVLVPLGLWQAGVQGGDGLGYRQLAINLLDHFEVSFSNAPPIEPTVYRSPGYPAFLALVYSVSRRSVPFVSLVQFFLVFLTAWAIFNIASVHTDRWAAAVSALLVVTYAPLVFLSTFHLTEVLATFLAASLILLVERSRAHGGYWTAFGIGIVSGALVLVRPPFSLVLFPVLVGLWLDRRAPERWRRTALIPVAAGCCGFALILAPWLARNAVLTGRLVMTSGSGESLYFSMLQYSGRISYAFTSDEWQQHYFPELHKKEEEVDRELRSDSALSARISVRGEMLLNESWRRSALDEASRLGVVQIARSAPIRLAYLWSTCDLSPQWLQAGIFHRFVQGQFLLVVVSAACGVVLHRRRLWQEWPLWVIPVYLTSIHLIFHVEPRYSMAGRPFVLVYSAFGIVGIWEATRKRIGISG